MKDIITNEFVYELYDSNKLDHISLIEELSNDYLTNEFFKDYKSIIDKTDSENYFTYIILNRYGLIGLITLSMRSHTATPILLSLKERENG